MAATAATIPTADININNIPNNDVREGSNATADANAARMVGLACDHGIDAAIAVTPTADISIDNIITNNDVLEGSDATKTSTVTSNAASASTNAVHVFAAAVAGNAALFEHAATVTARRSNIAARTARRSNMAATPKVPSS